MQTIVRGLIVTIAGALFEKELGDRTLKMEEAFGKVLREHRQKRKLSQEGLASCCELDRTYISLLERGKRNPSIGVLFKLAEALQIKPSVLISEIERCLDSKMAN